MLVNMFIGEVADLGPEIKVVGLYLNMILQSLYSLFPGPSCGLKACIPLRGEVADLGHTPFCSPCILCFLGFHVAYHTNVCSQKDCIPLRGMQSFEFFGYNENGVKKTIF